MEQRLQRYSAASKSLVLVAIGFMFKQNDHTGYLAMRNL